jgi:hypothetical protein
MNEPTERNAIIRSASVFIEDHGCLTAYLDLDYGGAGQGFGGYVLGVTPKSPHYEIKNYAGHFIRRCLEIAGVDSWEKLTGKTVRVRQTHTKATSIGHIVKDDWFTPSEDFGGE